MTEPRYLAAKLLDETFRRSGYSNLVLDSGMSRANMTKYEDRKLCAAIYYGVIERKITLDYIISGLSARPIDKLDSIVLNILRCGIYQILYMDGIPDNAAVNESVKLAKEFRKTSASGMVNAILRNFIRVGKKFELPKGEIEQMSVKYSVPTPLIESLIKDYGRELAEDIFADSLGPAPMFVRVNKIAEEIQERKFTEMWGEPDEARYIFEKSPYLPYCYKVFDNMGRYNIENSDMFELGMFHVQDLASQLCCAAVAPTENDIVLDMCAAPGGKTFTMAEMMDNKGKIYAFDLHEQRVGLIKKMAERLYLENITAEARDATVFYEDIPKATKILCDVPCSGYGVIRKKPEIRYKDISDFERLPEVQYRIAENALNYLADGGEMVYSTCTVRKAENEDVVQRLLANHPELGPAELPEPLGNVFSGGMAAIFPHHFGSDGFFIAKLRKK